MSEIDGIYRTALEAELEDKRAILKSGRSMGFANDAAYHRAKEIEKKLEELRNLTIKEKT